MIVKTNVALLSINAKQKQNSKDMYYILSFLDEQDNTFNLFIQQDMYAKALKLGAERFDSIYVTLSVYKDREGHYNFNLKDIELPPFDKK